MSRIKEALVFKNDEERMEWFQSLSPEEQAEVAKEAKEVVDNVIEAFRPVAEEFAKVFVMWYAKVFVMWFDLLSENLAEVGSVCNGASQQCAHPTSLNGGLTSDRYRQLGQDYDSSNASQAQ